MPDLFETLAERLVRAGVRPRAVRRFVTELSEHLEDLTDEGLAKGLPSTQARDEALMRLGKLDDLVLPMLADPRFRSWAGRFPWAVFLLVPVFAHLALLVTFCTMLVIVAKSSVFFGWFGTFQFVAQWMLLGAFPVFTSWTLILVATRQRTRVMWPLLGILLVIALASIIRFSVLLPSLSQQGEISIGVTLPSLSHLMALALLAAIPAVFHHMPWLSGARS